MKRVAAWLLSVTLAGALVSRSANAADDATRAKEAFKTGAAAYAAGEYVAAIRALETAYELMPLPAIAFSLAQAERKQYFVSHEADVQAVGADGRVLVGGGLGERELRYAVTVGFPAGTDGVEGRRFEPEPGPLPQFDAAACFE